MTIFIGYVVANVFFLLWVWSRYKMTNGGKVNTVRGFVAHCVRLIANGENRDEGEFFEPKHGIRTELIIPYGLFVTNTDEQVYNTANSIFDMACVEFPYNEGWRIQVLSSDETHYLSVIKSLKESIQ